MNFPFPHEHPYGETIVSVLNIPLRTVGGIQYVGIISLCLLLVSLYLLWTSVEKYRTRIVWLGIFLALFAPSYIARSFQKTFAKGIYAIYYDRDASNCKFEMTNKTTLHGKCELPFENYSREDVFFTIEFYEKYPFEEDVNMVTLMNNNAPYKVSLRGKERKRVKIETYIDVSKMKNHAVSGESNSISIIIKSGTKARDL
ncbi:hypothetical protein ABE288_02695 [Bacillus salipaludis]|uniref:hypothetical protein n=1 Tax=Bacillus salipaludis TaxID=2547811 RepID=UPI003D26025C